MYDLNMRSTNGLVHLFDRQVQPHPDGVESMDRTLLPLPDVRGPDVTDILDGSRAASILNSVPVMSTEPTREPPDTLFVEAETTLVDNAQDTCKSGTTVKVEPQDFLSADAVESCRITSRRLAGTVKTEPVILPTEDQISPAIGEMSSSDDVNAVRSLYTNSFFVLNEQNYSVTTGEPIPQTDVKPTVQTLLVDLHNYLVTQGVPITRDIGPVQHSDVTSQTDVRPVPHGDVTSQTDVRPVPHGDVTSQTDARPVPHGDVTSQTDVKPVPHGDVTSQTDARPVPHGDVTYQTDARPVPHGDVTSQTDVTPVPHGEVTSQTDVRPVPQSDVTSQTDVRPVPHSDVTSQTDVRPVPHGDVTYQTDGRPVPHGDVTSQTDVRPVPHGDVTSQTDVTPVPHSDVTSQTAAHFHHVSNETINPSVNKRVIAVDYRIQEESDCDWEHDSELSEGEIEMDPHHPDVWYKSPEYQPVVRLERLPLSEALEWYRCPGDITTVVDVKKVIAQFLKSKQSSSVISGHDDVLTVKKPSLSESTAETGIFPGKAVDLHTDQQPSTATSRDKYKDTRRKNNIAVRKCREIRKQKLRNMALEADHLEVQNKKLEAKIVEMERQVKELKAVLEPLESDRCHEDITTVDVEPVISQSGKGKQSPSVISSYVYILPAKKPRVSESSAESESFPGKAVDLHTDQQPSTATSRDKYKDTRRKNNIAVRKCREIRKQKLRNMALEADHLEVQNKKLEAKIVEMERQVKELKAVLEPLHSDRCPEDITTVDVEPVIRQPGKGKQSPSVISSYVYTLPAKKPRVSESSAESESVPGKAVDLHTDQQPSTSSSSDKYKGRRRKNNITEPLHSDRCPEDITTEDVEPVIGQPGKGKQSPSVISSYVHILPAKKPRVSESSAESESFPGKAVDLHTDQQPSTSSSGDKYKEKRRKNNIAVRKCLEIRKLKLRSMELEADHLEVQNKKLEAKIVDMERLAKEMKATLTKKFVSRKWLNMYMSIFHTE